MDRTRGEADGGQPKANPQTPLLVEYETLQLVTERPQEPKGHDEQGDAKHTLHVLHPASLAEQACAQGHGKKQRTYTE